MNFHLIYFDIFIVYFNHYLLYRSLSIHFKYLRIILLGLYQKIYQWFFILFFNSIHSLFYYIQVYIIYLNIIAYFNLPKWITIMHFHHVQNLHIHLYFQIYYLHLIMFHLNHLFIYNHNNLSFLLLFSSEKLKLF
jgi:hypothetical protein